MEFMAALRAPLDSAMTGSTSQAGQAQFPHEAVGVFRRQVPRSAQNYVRLDVGRMDQVEIVVAAVDGGGRSRNRREARTLCVPGFAHWCRFLGWECSGLQPLKINPEMVCVFVLPP